MDTITIEKKYVEYLITAKNKFLEASIDARFCLCEPVDDKKRMATIKKLVDAIYFNEKGF